MGVVYTIIAKDTPRNSMKLLLLVSIILAIASISMLSGCAWNPVIMRQYPSGLTIVRGDQVLLSQICSHISDKGKPITAWAGCYDPDTDTIYLENSCIGAKALTHELAHREGSADPEQDGYNW